SYAFLKHFEDLLAARPDRRFYPEGSPFYTMRNVAGYTYAPWKVVWREVSADFAPAVVGSVGGRPVVPDHTLVMIAFTGSEEAHYACGLLASSLYNLAINAYIVLHPSPHVLQNVRLARYDAANAIHSQLSSLSRKAHQVAPLAYAGDGEARARLRQIEAEVDRAAAELWGLSEEELSEVQTSLRELRG
ncbi:MAG: SAM-dependent DNA methyltransferase, partial [Anaerolineae bacterium]|nr:SAM-dependent DNA methyltransferase [Anaerolineae bacterium]